MEPGTQMDAAARFDPLRPRLVRIAYRMLGSVADAEDVVHPAELRIVAHFLMEYDAIQLPVLPLLHPRSRLTRATAAPAARMRT